jgi:hypothetical protein
MGHRYYFCPLSALLVLNAWLATPALPAPPPPAAPGPSYADDSVSIRIVQRSPEQLAAFYLARGFNQAAIDQILKTCVITPIIENKTFDALWLELDRWRFTRADDTIARLPRDYWPEQWRASGLPQAQQSTFGWTLLPEVRDLRIDESAGGSVIIPWQTRPFTLSMHFPTGLDRQGPVKTVIFEDLECVGDVH